ncbi:unnamed protein product [Lactuca virosa]|uniref:Uncharacterized protein n=1 Tax=Lactuca virosa TaxID=75947 RepID=A0AAU9MX16_9ASTR|nr:unnamed protein product [Lactuca virosa]CAH1445361.1 unnamed protein product [Lactuca virosa]
MLPFLFPYQSSQAPKEPPSSIAASSCPHLFVPHRPSLLLHSLSLLRLIEPRRPYRFVKPTDKPSLLLHPSSLVSSTTDDAPLMDLPSSGQVPPSSPHYFFESDEPRSSLSDPPTIDAHRCCFDGVTFLSRSRSSERKKATLLFLEPVNQLETG